jgi:hypothetical protein
MPALYVNKADLEAPAADAGYTLPPDDAPAPTALDRLVEEAQHDLDSILGNYEIITTGTYAGLKLDVTTLDYAQTQGLSRAMIAQVLYRLEMGPQFFVRPQMEEVAGPEFTTKGKLPRVSPSAKQELSGLSLIRLTTSIANKGRGLPPWYDFSYNVTPPGDGDYGGLNRGVLP